MIYDMTTIKFKDLNNEQVLDLLDDSVPYILIPNFSPNLTRQWWTTTIHLPSQDTLENLDVRDMTVDLCIDKKTVAEIFKHSRFNQISLLQFTKKPPDSLKPEELPEKSKDKILIQNGLVNWVWVDYEFVEFSSISEEFLESLKAKYSLNLI